MERKSKKSVSAPSDVVKLKLSPGDVLLSSMALPYPGAIVTGTKGSKNEPFEPYLDFRSIRRLLEFLEHVVLCERLILQVPQYASVSERLIRGKAWGDFAVFQAVGDLDYTTESLGKRLEQAGVLFPAQLAIGTSTADDLVGALLPNSGWMKKRFAYFADGATHLPIKRQASYINAQMAAHVGAPLHILEAAGLTGIPFIQSDYEAKGLAGYEREALRVRRSVTQLLLDRLNHGARKEIEKLADVGPVSVFPETPIARLIVSEAKTPEGLVETALALRGEFAGFRSAMNQLQSDLVSESLSLSVRLKRLHELEQLADALWKEPRKDLRTNAQAISEALFAIPEVVATPSVNSVASLANKLIALPVERLIGLYKHRKIRLLQKAKRNFLHNNDATAKLAEIFGVSETVARSSARNGRVLRPAFVKANPEWMEMYARLKETKG